MEQYSNFTVLDPSGGPPIPVNGKLCLGENIADAGGLSASFQTWKRKEEESPEQLLPGIPGFTKEQIFFLAYANVWCGVVRPEEARSRVLTDPHSPIEWRIKVGVYRTLLQVPVDKLTFDREPCRTRGSSGRPSIVL